MGTNIVNGVEASTFNETYLRLQASGFLALQDATQTIDFSGVGLTSDGSQTFSGGVHSGNSNLWNGTDGYTVPLDGIYLINVSSATGPINANLASDRVLSLSILLNNISISSKTDVVSGISNVSSRSVSTSIYVLNKSDSITMSTSMTGLPLLSTGDLAQDCWMELIRL